MSFASREKSEQDGQPAYLWQFSRTGKSWFYTNCTQDITLDGDVYLSIPAGTSAVVQSSEVTGSTAEITLPASAGLSQYLDLLTPSFSISVLMRKLHMTVDEATGVFSEPIDIADAPAFWAGEITGIQRPSPNKRVLQCHTRGVTLSRVGLRLSWSRGCPHMLYERGCFVDKASFVTTLASVTIVNGVSISASEFDAQPDGWFDFGFLEWELEAGVTERRGIESHVGDTVVLFGTTQAIAGGINYKAYAGCNRTSAMCDDKFSNLNNYGGFKLRGKNPFDGSQVF